MVVLEVSDIITSDMSPGGKDKNLYLNVSELYLILKIHKPTVKN